MFYLSGWKKKLMFNGGITRVTFGLLAPDISHSSFLMEVIYNENGGRVSETWHAEAVDFSRD